MYAKTVNYGNTIENTHGKAVGAIKVEILPQGTFLNHVQITIEEAHPMGKHPEPMLRVSVNNQKDVVITLQTALKALGFFDGPNLGNIAIGQNLHNEKESKNETILSLQDKNERLKEVLEKLQRINACSHFGDELIIQALENA